MNRHKSSYTARRRKARRPRVYRREGGSGCGCFLLFLLVIAPFGFGLWIIYQNYAETYGAPPIAEFFSGAQSAAADAFSVADVREVETYVVKFTNEERGAAGLTPLQHDERISEIARAHSAAMLRTGKLEHVLGGKDPTDRAETAGYNCRRALGGGRYSFGLSENIHMQTGSWHSNPEVVARNMVDGWMNSPGHRANIMDPMAVRIGVGIAREGGTWYATQNFSECQ